MEGESPAARIRLIFALSQVVTPFPERNWTQLLEQARLLSTCTRVAALQPPVLRGRPPELPAALAEEMAATFRHEPDGDIEAAWYAVRYGEFLGWLGRFEDAFRVLAEVPVMTATANREAWNAATYRERRRAEERVRDWARESGARVALPPPVPDPPELWVDFWRHTPFRVAAVLVENAQRARAAGREDVVRICLDVARAEFARMPLETEFHLDAEALERTAPGRSAASEESLEPLAATTSQRTARPSGTRLGGGPFTVLEVRERHGRLATRTDIPAREQVISAENPTIEALVRARGIPRRLAGMSIDELRQDLCHVVDATGISPESSRVALAIRLSSLSCAPWELAFGGPRAPFRLPSAWVEDDVEAQARLAATTPRSGPVTPVPPLLVLPASPLDRESPAINAYIGLRAHFERRFGENDRAGSTQLVQVVYVGSSFTEIPSLNEPALAGLEWTASTLAHELSRRRAADKPVVVLDVPLPATHSDLLHQLLLRNYFAQGLIDSGMVACVLATGLRAERSLEALHRTVVAALSVSGTPRLELLDGAAATATKSGAPALDAFFTAHPYLPLFPAASRQRDG
ncbi:MAG: hypothetical protein H0V80_12485 [Acidobacteria bacterium]|nr:hypothetical protein [Acidobacteriota bacterium]